jgi:hypothetical protein
MRPANAQIVEMVMINGGEKAKREPEQPRVPMPFYKLLILWLRG